MDGAHRTRPIVVGIDGSQAAIEAVRWAIDEAVSREVTLRLVHVTGKEVQPATVASADNERLQLEYGEKTLAYVSRLWGREVVLETTLQGKRSLLCYNERGFSMRALK